MRRLSIGWITHTGPEFTASGQRLSRVPLRVTMNRVRCVWWPVAVTGILSLIILLDYYLYAFNNCFTDSPNVRTAEALGALPPGQHLEKTEMMDKRDKEVCHTPGCIHSASKVLNAIDSSIEPCDDFYHFACGNFVKETNIPDEKVSVNTFSIIGDLLQEQLRSLVSEEPRADEAKPFRLAKDFFKACMNKSELLHWWFIESLVN